MASNDLPGTLQFDLITPTKKFFSGAVSMVVVPGELGDFGVLPGHAPFISAVRPGVVIIKADGGAQRKVAVIGGFAEVVPDHCTLLAEVAIDCEGMSAADAEARLDEARTELEAAENDATRSLAEKKIAMAQALAHAL